jgi:GLPGLI family protein
MKKDGKLGLIIIFILTIQFHSIGQYQSGKIIFERKTNLEKKFKGVDDEWMKEFLAINKYKTDLFELYFTDSTSLFKPVDSDLQEEYSWTTIKNTVLLNFKKDEKLSKITIYGQDMYVKNSTQPKIWKITDSKRMIGNYVCTKAVWENSDTSKIYVWFSNEILPSVGPESFYGLPGTILGVASEDGGVVYFAKSVELIPNVEEKIKLDLKKKKVMSSDEFKSKMKESIGDSKFEKKFLSDLFTWM